MNEVSQSPEANRRSKPGMLEIASRVTVAAIALPVLVYVIHKTRANEHVLFLWNVSVLPGLILAPALLGICAFSLSIPLIALKGEPDRALERLAVLVGLTVMIAIYSGGYERRVFDAAAEPFTVPQALGAWASSQCGGAKNVLQADRSLRAFSAGSYSAECRAGQSVKADLDDVPQVTLPTLGPFSLRGWRRGLGPS